MRRLSQRRSDESGGQTCARSAAFYGFGSTWRGPAYAWKARREIRIAADAEQASAPDAAGMATRTYAITWWRDSGTPEPGKLELRDGIALFSARDAEPVELDLGQVVEVSIARSAPPAGDLRPTLVLRRRHAGAIFIRSVLGFGVLHELADAFAARPAVQRPRAGSVVRRSPSGGSPR
jgi:hypothetical protein